MKDLRRNLTCRFLFEILNTTLVDVLYHGCVEALEALNDKNPLLAAAISELCLCPECRRAAAECYIWYTKQKFPIAEFIGLLAIPIHIGGIADSVMHADFYVLDRLGFLFHDELHAIGLISTERDELKRAKIELGSVEHYQLVLERVRFTKRFLTWASSIVDPVLRDIVSIIWFDAFHDYFQSKAPFRNYSMSKENLRSYIGRHLSVDDPDPSRFTLEKIVQGYKLVAGFSGYDPAVHGDRFWDALKRKIRNGIYLCSYYLLPYEEVF